MDSNDNSSPESNRSTEPTLEPVTGVKLKVRQIIFGTYTPAGKTFDVVLIFLILSSVIAVMLDSVQSVSPETHRLLRQLEWIFTVLFTIEYAVRLWSAPASIKYARSFYGIIDLLAILPSYLSLLLPGAEYLLVVRALRVLRVFRILKLLSFMDGEQVIRNALINSRHKITVFMVSVGILVVIMGSVIYLIEGEDAGFTSIPTSIYWAIVTLTTVGYGDIVPATPIGKFLASLVMLTGYAIIAVPTGIVTAELTRSQFKQDIQDTQDPDRFCGECGHAGHAPNAKFCDQCGKALPTVEN